MPCISLPELSEAQLMAFLDGEADEEVAAHMQRCASCRRRAERLARVERTLRRRLFRAACPTSLELGEYHLDALSPLRAEAIARHLTECPYCAREVADLKGYLAGLAPELMPGPVERLADRALTRARVLVARLTSGATSGPFPGGTAAVHVGLRGADEGPLVYETDDAQIVIQVEQDLPQPDRWSLLGLVTGLEAAGDLAAHLWRGTGRVVTARVDELGNFTFSDLPAGEYDLILQGAEVEIHIQGLAVKTSV